MLQLLTYYLFQYKKVFVPHLGTIHLVQHAPVLQVVDKKLGPPLFTAELKKDDDLPPHQLEYLAACMGGNADTVLKELNFLGDKLQEKINGSGFEWQGLGTFTRSTQSLPISLQSFETIKAEKIIRHHPTHAVLVGDREMTSLQMNERKTIRQPEKKASYKLLFAWIILLLSAIAIAFVLYIGKFRVNAAGLKQNFAGYFSSSQ